MYVCVCVWMCEIEKKENDRKLKKECPRNHNVDRTMDASLKIH